MLVWGGWVGGGGPRGVLSGTFTCPLPLGGWTLRSDASWDLSRPLEAIRQIMKNAGPCSGLHSWRRILLARNHSQPPRQCQGRKQSRGSVPQWNGVESNTQRTCRLAQQGERKEADAVEDERLLAPPQVEGGRHGGQHPDGGRKEDGAHPLRQAVCA